MAGETSTQRTLIAEYQVKDENGNPVRRQPGEVITFSATQLERAVAAGVVYADDDRNAEVPVRDNEPVNDPKGVRADESRGSGPSADDQRAPRNRKR